MGAGACAHLPDAQLLEDHVAQQAADEGDERVAELRGLEDYLDERPEERPAQDEDDEAEHEADEQEGEDRVRNLPADKVHRGDECHLLRVEVPLAAPRLEHRGAEAAEHEHGDDHVEDERDHGGRDERGVRRVRRADQVLGHGGDHRAHPGLLVRRGPEDVLHHGADAVHKLEQVANVLLVEAEQPVLQRGAEVDPGDREAHEKVRGDEERDDDARRHAHRLVALAPDEERLHVGDEAKAGRLVREDLRLELLALGERQPPRLDPLRKRIGGGAAVPILEQVLDVSEVGLLALVRVLGGEPRSERSGPGLAAELAEKHAHEDGKVPEEHDHGRHEPRDRHQAPSR